MAVATVAREYPVEWEADVVLRDGSVAHVRPIRPDDAEGITRFHAGQSDESIYLRFFAPLKQLSDRDLYRFTHVDYEDRVALVATHRGAIIGIGRYDRITPTDAEVAFNVSALTTQQLPESLANLLELHGPVLHDAVASLKAECEAHVNEFQQLAIACRVFGQLGQQLKDLFATPGLPMLGDE